MAQMTSLAVAISSTGATSMTVADYLGFPSTGQFSVLIDSELLRVTAGNGTTSWTVTRGYGGTTAATHLINATVTHVLDAYATVSDVLATMDLPDTSRYAFLTDLLARGAAFLNDRTGRRFWRDPQTTGDATVYFDVTRGGYDSLSFATEGLGTTDGRALDIISTTTLSVRESETSSYTALTEGTDFVLRRGVLTGIAGTDIPWEDVRLLPTGRYPTWPTGYAAVKHIGPLGFPAVPTMATLANVDLAREWYRQGPGGGPSQQGVNQFGVPVLLTGLPPSVKEFIAQYSKRSYAAV